METQEHFKELTEKLIKTKVTCCMEKRKQSSWIPSRSPEVQLASEWWSWRGINLSNLIIDCWRSCDHWSVSVWQVFTASRSVEAPGVRDLLRSLCRCSLCQEGWQPFSALHISLSGFTSGLRVGSWKALTALSRSPSYAVLARAEGRCLVGWWTFSPV